MAATTVDTRMESIWTVEAKCLDDHACWQFKDEESARWFRDVAQEWYCARCPTCGMKDIVNVTLDASDHGMEVIVSCGWHDCSFAQRIVSYQADKRKSYECCRSFISDVITINQNLGSCI